MLPLERISISDGYANEFQTYLDRNERNKNRSCTISKLVGMRDTRIKLKRLKAATSHANEFNVSTRIN